MHGSKLASVAAAVVLLIAVAGNAQAAPGGERKVTDKEKQQARALYEEGLRRYNVAEYDAAIEAFKAAYLLLGDPHLLFDVAQSYRLSGDCPQALRFYRTYLRERPKAADPTETATIEGAIAKCEKAVASAASAAPAPPPVTPVQPPPPAATPAPPPAPVTGVAPDVSRRADDPGPWRAVDPGRNKRVAGLAVGITSAIIAGTGVAVGLYGRAQSQDLAQHQGEWSAAEKRAETSARRLGTAGQILTGIGATGVVAGVALYLMGASQKRSASRVDVAVGPHGGGVWVSSSF